MNTLINALQNSLLYPHPVEQFELIETHISWVLLTGRYAYKIKKPVNFGFLDFSTLKKRRFFCREELRLNRHFSKDLYLEVVSIGGSRDNPRFNQGEAIEYAVKMRQFDNNSLFERIVLMPAHIDHLATRLAAFHKQARIANLSKPYGLPKNVQQTVLANFKLIFPLLEDDGQLTQLQELQTWTALKYSRIKGLMWRRRENGFIRECHGDLHLGNIILLKQRPVFFDCIEFNPSLRWIDVISELAFTLMDLEFRRQSQLAWRLLNQYLAYSGDYVGLRLLNYYKLYRAMVRAKVSMLEKTDEGRQRYQQYVNLGETYTAPAKRRLIVMRGLSGSGKSYLASELSQTLPAIHLNSDVTRKRLTGHTPSARTKSGIAEGIYTPEISRKTYQTLLKNAEISLKAGFSAIVDATFLHPDSLAQQQELARELGVAFVIVDVQVSVECLRERVAHRFAKACDPSEADLEVLESQLANYQPLEANSHVLIIRNEDGFGATELKPRLLAFIEEG